MLFSSVALKALSPCQNGREGKFCYYFVTRGIIVHTKSIGLQQIKYIALFSASESNPLLFPNFDETNMQTNKNTI